jgi:phage host-nuclease inhibitor protein Gam
MARVRMPDKCDLANWDDVNLTLAEIGELERKLTDIETKMQKKIDDAKLDASVETEPHQKRIKELEKQLKMFVDDHAADFGKKKTKFLSFGKLGYRESSSVKLPKDKDKLEEIIRKIKAHGMSDCLVVQPDKIDKEQMKKYSAEKIKAVGAVLKVGDTFWYEVDKEKLAEGPASGR